MTERTVVEKGLVHVDYSIPCKVRACEIPPTDQGRVVYDMTRASIRQIGASNWLGSACRGAPRGKWASVHLLAAIVASEWKVPFSWHRRPNGTIWFQHILFPDGAPEFPPQIPALVHATKGWSEGFISVRQSQPNIWVLDVSKAVVERS